MNPEAQPEVGTLVRAPAHPEWGIGRVTRFNEPEENWVGSVTVWFADNNLHNLPPTEVEVVQD